MGKLKNYKVICGAHNGIELFLYILIVLTRNDITGPKQILQVAGFSVFAFGLFLLIYSGVHLRRASRIKARRGVGVLATDGPFKIVRHPYYLGDIILVMGLAIGLRSIWGIIGTLILLIPSAIYVARLEDNTLAEKFGEDWRSYKDRTYFMFPPVF